MIPNNFTLGALNYRTELVDNIDETGLGRCWSYLGLIRLANNYQGYIIPEDSKERTFYHELVHAILTEIGESELNKNEQFIESFSALLYQFEMTKR